MARYSFRQMGAWFRSLTKSTQVSLQETAQAVLEAMKEEGKPVTYPIQWDSDKQKRAFFATDGFGSGIPYQRTQTYRFSGTVEPTSFGARLYKPHPAGAIGGTFGGWQSRIHRGRWKLLVDAIRTETDKLPARIRDRMKVTEGNLDANP